MPRRRQKPYRIIGAYDSETSNIVRGARKYAYPILHQLGIINCPIEQVHSSDVETHTEIKLFRHSVELYDELDSWAARELPFVPVIACHNLSFDMWGLSPWLNSHHVKVLAKSQQKPITFTILGEDSKTPRLVIWDTLAFSGHDLGYMGEECGYPKLRGDWDYSKVRTPQTPLTGKETAYAKHDVFALLAWLGYWCRLNPDIESSMLGLRVVTKTGVVRQRRVSRFSNLRGKGMKRKVGEYWMMTNQAESFADDEELFTCNAATRGGFTFCASKNASRVFDFAEDSCFSVYGYDATSQHPSQMVSHLYPQGFHKTSGKALENAFSICKFTKLDKILTYYEKPFPKAFYAVFEFTNLRPKRGSLFERFGIYPLAWARCKPYRVYADIAEDNQQGEEFKEYIAGNSYKDEVSDDAEYSFGKLESASYAKLFLTELSAWELCQAYEFDSVRAVSGYMTGRFYKPSDMSVISVMQFYKGKNEFKHARACYYGNEPIDNADKLQELGIPQFVIDGMIHHEIEDSTVESTYLGLKADLNALFGIEACNEYRRETVLTDNGIAYEGDFGICNKPTKCKAFYQFGQRIVGWSRVAQIITMQLCEPYIETIINGDTDSIKFVVADDNIDKVNAALGKMRRAIDRAKAIVCERVKRRFPNMYDSLDGIGYYVLEFSTRRFCASWNKAYCVMERDSRDGKEHAKFTVAGVPTGNGVNALADKMMNHGSSFEEVCDELLGYNVTYAHDITQLNTRAFPLWGELVTEKITDYRGNTSMVCEPHALALYPMAKTVNDTQVKDNRVNLEHAVKNRPSVKENSRIVTLDGIVDIGDMFDD